MKDGQKLFTKARLLEPTSGARIWDDLGKDAKAKNISRFKETGLQT